MRFLEQAFPALTVLAAAAVYVFYAYRYSKHHPRRPCPVCNGTKRWVDSFQRFQVCLECDENGEVIG